MSLFGCANDEQYLYERYGEIDMSKVNTKLEYPQFKIEELMQIITSICDATNFPGEHLINLILANWIYTFNLGVTSGMSPSEVMIQYLKKSRNLSEDFTKLKEVENGKTKN